MSLDINATVKVLSLNCWAVPITFVSKLRTERIKAIGEELGKGEYDIVLLQEIWSQADYDKLCDKILPKLMYTHYWHSGVIGSGLCIFSKYPIVETFAHAFSVNGYAHRILHGDWYGGKVVGLARLAISEMLVNVYCTHTHAEYCDVKHFRDEYTAHRVTQAFELSEFIKVTSEGCDAVLVGGDFNVQPHELGYKIITSNANVKDAWITQREGEREHKMTSSSKSNSFTEPHKQDKCIDYLMYRNNTGHDMICKRCVVTMGKVPGNEYNYSDHEAVAAEFVIKRNVTAMTPERDAAALEEILPEAMNAIDTGIQTIRSARFFYVAMVIFSITLLMFTNNVMLPFGLGWLLSLVRIVLVLVAAFAIWMVSVVDVKDKNGLLAARKDINRLLSH